MPQDQTWLTEYGAVVEALKGRIGSSTSCAELVGSFEELVRSIWIFTARLLGEAGARAVMTRSLSLAVRDVPLLRTVSVAADGVHLAEFQDHANREGCSDAEITEALLYLGAMVFKTLGDLAGEALTGPLLEELQGPRP